MKGFTMRICLALFCAASLTQAASAEGPADILFGTFSNEEQVYFDKDSGNTPPPWFSLRIGRATNGALVEEIDAFGAADSEGHALQIKSRDDKIVLDYGACQRLYTKDGDALVASGATGKCAAPATMTRIGPEGITLGYPDGKTSLLRRARPVTCWSAIPKEAKKADGSADWFFARDVNIHDQGGRAMIGKDAVGVKPVVIRMRNVVWPPKPDGSANTNRPSLVLYVHMPDEPDRAVSYVWADPEAARIGINLRWMQASCTIDGKEKAGG
jgi:hypothetical protein